MEIPVPGLTTDDLPVVQLYRRRTTAAPISPPFDAFNPDPKNNRGISGVERLRTPVAGILIVGLQLH